MTNLLTVAKGGRRLCGAGRTAGSVYVECGVPLHGTPIERFLHDPPVPVDPVQLGLSAQGVSSFRDEQGVLHLVDWVGESHYAYPADFIEEARSMGVSRKIPVNTDLRGLTAASKLILLHASASVENAKAVSLDSEVRCPNNQHLPGEDCCGLHWVVPEANDGPDYRKLADGKYILTPRLFKRPAPVLSFGYFMAVPITNVTVIRNHDGTVDERAQASANRAGVPVVHADE